MNIEKLFSITTDSDLTEGRGHTVVLGYARTLDVANAIVSDGRFGKHCVMGVHDPLQCRKYNVASVDLVVFDQAEEFFNRDEAKEREKALSKLTVRERKLLNLE